MNGTQMTVSDGGRGRGADRRGHRRYGVVRGGKVFHRAAGRFCGARTRNLSRAGALLEVQTGRGLEAGELVDVGIAWRGGAVVAAEGLRAAMVVRAGEVRGGTQEVGVRFVGGV